MKDSEIDLLKELEDLEAKAKSIDEVAKLYRNRILDLQNQVQISELSVKEAEDRANSAEELAQTATEKYKKAIALKEGQYEQLIGDLFEVPQQILLKQIRAQSRRSNRSTVTVAVVSIILSSITSFGISTYFQNQSSASGQALIAKMDRALTSVESIEGSTQYAMENIWSTEPNVKRLLRVIYQNRSKFSNYEPENNMALAYKIRISSNAGNAKYDEIVRAFRAAGINREALNEAKLKQWDSEYLSLCKNSVEALKTLKPEDALSETDRRIGRFKTPADPTDYLNWEWTVKTNGELLKIYESLVSDIQARIKFNEPGGNW